MKATGIARRIDDLRGIVIHKEIRRTMRIREGDPLQIHIDTNELLTVFKKIISRYRMRLLQKENTQISVCHF